MSEKIFTLLPAGDSVPQHPDDQNGEYLTLSGHRLLLCHADEDGMVEEWAERRILREKPEYVVSCFPQEVAKRYGVKTLGDWEVTEAYIRPLVDRITLRGQEVFAGILLLEVRQQRNGRYNP